MRYDKYKETGVEWLPQIPAGWLWRFLSQVAKEQTIRKPKDTDFQVMSLSYGNVIRKKNIDAGLVPTSYDNYQVINAGNIILRLTDLQNDHTSLRTGLVHETGIITSAYTCILPFENPAFVHYLLHAYDTRKIFYGMGGGVRQSIGYKDIRNMMLPVPPREEQDQIVRYLDWQVSKTNKLISALKKQIALLKEQKQAVINQAVTKGLNPNAPMKDSGVAWIGIINKNVQLIKLKYLLKASLQYGANASGIPYVDTLYRYIRITDITLDGSLKTYDMLSMSIEEGKNYELHDDDILFARSGASVGKTFIYKNRYGLSCFAGYLIRATANSSIVLPDYLYYFTKSGYYDLWLNRIFIQATIQNVSAEKYKNLIIPIWSLKEQKKIIKHLNEKCSSIDVLVENIKKKIVTVTEYRTRLIADVVTGQIDVRGIEIPDFEITLDADDEASEEDENTEADDTADEEV